MQLTQLFMFFHLPFSVAAITALQDAPNAISAAQRSQGVSHLGVMEEVVELEPEAEVVVGVLH